MKRCSYCGFDVPLEMECEIDGVSVRSHELCVKARAPTWNVREVADKGMEFLGYNVTYLSAVCHRREPVGDSVPWAKDSLVAWCDACWHPQTDTIEDLDMATLFSANVAAMGFFDFGALIFASFVVSFTVVGELKDTILCSLAVERAEEALSPGWRVLLRLMNGCRRRLFLPMLMHAVPILVVHLGGGERQPLFLHAAALLFRFQC